MKRKDGKLYYNIRETGYIINRSNQTIRNWIAMNTKLIEQGKKGIIPVPTAINDILYFSSKDIEVIKNNMRNFKRGDFKELTEKTTAYQRLKAENANLLSQIKELKEGVR